MSAAKNIHFFKVNLETEHTLIVVKNVKIKNVNLCVDVRKSSSDVCFFLSQMSSIYIFKDTHVLYFEKMPITFFLFLALPLISEKPILFSVI